MEKLAIVVPCYNEEEVLKIASEVNPSYDYDFASEMMERFSTARILDSSSSR